MPVKPDRKTWADWKAFSAFRLHATLFILVIGGLWLAWLLGGYLALRSWLIIPTVTWGLILVIHFVIAYRELQEDINKNEKL